MRRVSKKRAVLLRIYAKRRAVLYVAAGVAVLTMTAEPRLWNTSGAGGKLAFLLLLGAAGYAAFAVIRSARRY